MRVRPDAAIALTVARRDQLIYATAFTESSPFSHSPATAFATILTSLQFEERSFPACHVHFSSFQGSWLRPVRLPSAACRHNQSFRVISTTTVRVTSTSR